MAMLVVDGVSIKEPSKFQWSLQDVSAPDSGRTEDSVMHKNRVAQKVKLELQWTMTTPQETSDILQAFQPEYINVTYHDPLLNDYRTAEFYVGDRSAPVKFWLVDKKYYESVSFNIIER